MKQVHDMLDDSDNDDDVDLDLSCDSSDSSDSDDASERDVEPDTGDDSDPDDVGQSADVKKTGDVSIGGFDWSGPVGGKPCLPAFTGEIGNYQRRTEKVFWSNFVDGAYQKTCYCNVLVSRPALCHADFW